MRPLPARARLLGCGALTVLALGMVPACGSPVATPVGAAAATATTPGGTAPGSATASPAAVPSGEAAAGLAPVRVKVPALGIDAPVLPNGLNADGTVGVPGLDRIGDVHWYDGSSRPGATGRSVLLGHVDGNGKPGVFWALKDARPGTEVTVVGEDGRTASYRITEVVTHLKSRFPTELVYGDSAEAELRLVTCGGRFDPAARSYESNVIALATLIKEAR